MFLDGLEGEIDRGHTMPRSKSGYGPADRVNIVKKVKVDGQSRICGSDCGRIDPLALESEQAAKNNNVLKAFLYYLSVETTETLSGSTHCYVCTVSNKARVSETTRAVNLGSRTSSELSIGLPLSS